MAVSSLMVPLGTQAPGFTLPGTSGTMTGLDDFTATPALLVAFLCNHCPYVRHIETALGALLSRYPDLAVVGICTNDADAYPGDQPHELAGRPGAPAGPSLTWSTPARRSAALTTPPARQTSSSMTARAGWPTVERSTSPHPVTASRSPASCSAPPSN